MLQAPIITGVYSGCHSWASIPAESFQKPFCSVKTVGIWRISVYSQLHFLRLVLPLRSIHCGFCWACWKNSVYHVMSFSLYSNVIASPAVAMNHLHFVLGLDCFFNRGSLTHCSNKERNKKESQLFVLVELNKIVAMSAVELNKIYCHVHSWCPDLISVELHQKAIISVSLDVVLSWVGF